MGTGFGSWLDKRSRQHCRLKMTRERLLLMLSERVNIQIGCKLSIEFSQSFSP